MELFIVDFSYYDCNEEVVTEDRWILACKNSEELVKLMELNFDEFKECGHEPIDYSFQYVSRTDNDYEIVIKS